MLLEANPFEDNDFNQFFKTAFPDDTFRRIAQHGSTKTIHFRSLSPLGKNEDSGIASAFHHYSLFWTAGFIGIFVSGADFHFIPAFATIKSRMPGEQLAALTLITLLNFWFLSRRHESRKASVESFFHPGQK